jgi:hypothetical protein
VNVCRPDSRKSCAACCGLYNVPDATRPTLQAKLERRTKAFRDVERSPAAIEGYQLWVRSREAETPLEEVIHVCEFVGFLDPLHRIVGCQLHPTAPGNNGLDLRGLCYYGSMACKSFFCPAWEEIPPRFRDLVCLLVDDWHVYGLIVTDVDFVRALIALLENRVGAELDPAILQSSLAGALLTRMLSWKDSWPFGSNAPLRRNRYYFKGTTSVSGDALDRLLACLCFTFGQDEHADPAREFVDRAVEDFAKAYAGQE